MQTILFFCTAASKSPLSGWTNVGWAERVLGGMVLPWGKNMEVCLLSSLYSASFHLPPCFILSFLLLTQSIRMPNALMQSRKGPLHLYTTIKRSKPEQDCFHPKGSFCLIALCSSPCMYDFNISPEIPQTDKRSWIILNIHGQLADWLLGLSTNILNSNIYSNSC